jgi:hypothetical protein
VVLDKDARRRMRFEGGARSAPKTTEPVEKLICALFGSHSDSESLISGRFKPRSRPSIDPVATFLTGSPLIGTSMKIWLSVEH